MSEMKESKKRGGVVKVGTEWGECNKGGREGLIIFKNIAFVTISIVV